MSNTEFESFAKIPRLSRAIVVTEKIDGTNSQILIGESGEFMVGSRNRWLSEAADNFGFYKWAMEHKDELMTLGVGRHFGEWWGCGIQRGYGALDKRFSLFNVDRWGNDRPSCCGVVPILYRGDFETKKIDEAIDALRDYGSIASPGFMDAEGVVIYHYGAKNFFKKTIKNDGKHKWEL